MASLVCPYLQQTGPSWTTFSEFWSSLRAFVRDATNVLVSAVVTNASWKYDFLPLTLCTINPLITTSLVRYANGVINTTVISSRPIGSGNTNLTQFLAALVDYQSRTTQGLTTNSIGDALYSLYISLSSSNSTTAEHLTDTLLWEMVSFFILSVVEPSDQARFQEQYWRGVVKFSGTVCLFPSPPSRPNQPDPHHSSSDPHFL